MYSGRTCIIWRWTSPSAPSAESSVYEGKKYKMCSKTFYFLAFLFLFCYLYLPRPLAVYYIYCIIYNSAYNILLSRSLMGALVRDVYAIPIYIYICLYSALETKKYVSLQCYFALEKKTVTLSRNRIYTYIIPYMYKSPLQVMSLLQYIRILFPLAIYTYT